MATEGPAIFKSVILSETADFTTPKTIKGLESATLNLTINGITVTSLSSAGWEEIIPGIISGEIGLEVVANETGAADEFTSAELIELAITNKPYIYAMWTQGAVGDKVYSAKALITAANMSGSYSEGTKVSFTLTFSGEVTVTDKT